MSEFDPRSLEPFWDNWYIDRLIGEGSFGTVYKVYREEFGTRYYSALKIIAIPRTAAEEKQVLYDGMDEKSATLYFNEIIEDVCKEISIMAELKGKTNIVSYEDHKIIKKPKGIGSYIIIRMELLESLNDYLLHQTLTNEMVINIGKDICEALILCQRRNLIHRDIKPANIFVSVDGDFKLGDFGISRHLEGMQDGLSVKGTYVYMAPEVYQGGRYDARVDIYSLGMMMYYFLNNKREPFSGGSTVPKYSERKESLRRRFSGEKLPKPANAEDDLAEVILKACEFNPDNRYSSADEFLKALEALPPRTNVIPLVTGNWYINNSNANENNEDRVKSVSSDRSGNDNPDLHISASYPLDEATAEEFDATVMLEDEKTELLHVEPVPNEPGSVNKRSKRGFIIAIAAALSMLIFICGMGVLLFLQKDKDIAGNDTNADTTGDGRNLITEIQGDITSTPVVPTPSEPTSTEPTPIESTSEGPTTTDSENPQLIEDPIDVSGQGIDDLTGIYDIEHVTILDASNNNITDITVLSDSIWMKFLNLEDNQISDLTPVSSMQMMTVLSMSNNNISDVAPLSGLQSCMVLILSNNQISNISDLRNLPSLTNLWLDGNRELSDIRILSNLKNLEELKLSGTEVSDISVLGALKELISLDISNTNITDIKPLYGLTNLQVLDLTNTGVPSDQKKQIKTLLPDCEVYY